MKVEDGEKIFAQIAKEQEQAEKYLLAGAKDKSRYSRAVAIVENRLAGEEKIILDSRRELEHDRKYKSRRHWVIKTQFIFNRIAEEKGLPVCWLSESKIKRVWRHIVIVTTEVAARLE